MLVTGDQQLLRQTEHMALVRRLAIAPQWSRADLAVGLGLTKSTVGLLVRDLVEEGWLNESDLVTTGSLGRRPTPVHINGQRLALISAEVGVDAACVAVTSPLGDVIEHAEVDYEDATHPLARLSLGHGVGAGVIVRDKLLTSYRGFAGEVGRTILQAAGPQCSCGRRGCAEALIRPRALVGDTNAGARHRAFTLRRLGRGRRRCRAGALPAHTAHHTTGQPRRQGAGMSRSLAGPVPHHLPPQLTRPLP